MGLDPFTIAFIVSTTISVAAAAVAKKKAEKAREESLGQDVRNSNSAQAISAIYGRTATTGTDVFVDVGNVVPALPLAGRQDNLLPKNGQPVLPHVGKKNNVLFSQTVISVGEIDNIEDMWVDDLEPTNEEIGGTIMSQWEYNAYNYAASATTSKITAASKFTDLSYANNWFILNRDDPQFSGVPRPLYFVDGIKVHTVVRSGSANNYTYALSSTKTFTPNAAYVLLDYLIADNYGLNWDPVEDIDLESFYEAAQICGEVVQGANNIFEASLGNTIYPFIGSDIIYKADGNLLTAADGLDYASAIADYYIIANSTGFGWQDSVVNYTSITQLLRYEFNGTLSTGAEHRDNIGTILAVIPGAEFFRSPKGEWKLVVPNSLTPAGQQSVGTITTDDLVSDISVAYPDTTARLNQVDLRFANANLDYADDNLVTPVNSSVTHTSYKSNDNGLDLIDEIEIRGVNNEYHAKSVAGNIVRISRQPAYSFNLRPKGFLYEPGDIIEIKDEMAGIGYSDSPTTPRSSLYIKVIETKVKTNLNVEITGIEFDLLDYAWELSPYQARVDRNIMDRAIGAPISLALTRNTTDRTNTLTWAPNLNEDNSVNGYVVEAIKVSSDINGNPVTPLTSEIWETVATTVISSTKTIHSLGNDAVRYAYRVRAKTFDNRFSDYSTIIYDGTELAANTAEADADAANASVNLIFDSYTIPNLVPDSSGELAGDQGGFLVGSGWDTEDGNWEIATEQTPVPKSGNYMLKMTSAGEADAVSEIVKIPLSVKTGDKFTVGLWVYQTVAGGLFKLAGGNWTYSGTNQQTVSNQWVFVTGQYTAGQDDSALNLQKRSQSTASQAGDTWIDSVMIVKDHVDLSIAKTDDTVATNMVLASIALRESRAIAHQTDNIIGKGQFEDNKIGNWQSTNLSVEDVPITHPLGHTKCIEQSQRSNYYYDFYSSDTAITPHSFIRGNLHGRKLRFTGYVYPDANYNAKVGLRTIDSTGSNTFVSTNVATAGGTTWTFFDVILTVNDADGVEFAPQLMTDAASGTAGLSTYWSDLKLVDISESEFALTTAQAASAAAASAATAATNAQNTADLAQTSAEVLAAIAADTTVIDGARITTGTIAAARVSISGLNISDLNNDSGFSNNDQANIATTNAANAAAAAVTAQAVADNAQSLAVNASNSVNGNLIGKGVFEDGEKSTWSSTTAVYTLSTAESTAHPLNRTKALQLTSSNGIFYSNSDEDWFSGYLHGRTFRATGYVYNQSTLEARIGVRTRNGPTGSNVNQTEKIADANGTGWLAFDVEIEVNDSDSVDFLPLIRINGSSAGNTMNMLVTDLQLIDITDAAENAAAATLIASDLNTVEANLVTAQADIATAEADIITALSNAATAQSTADGKVESFYQTSAPTSASAGDFWIDTDDDNKLYIYESSAWVLARDAGIAQAILDAAGAQNTADGKITTFYNNNAPASANTGDLWIDTNDANKLYRYASNSWSLVRDSGIDTALDLVGLENLVIDSDFERAGIYGDFLPNTNYSLDSSWELETNGSSPSAHSGTTTIKLKSASHSDSNATIVRVYTDVKSGDKITIGAWIYQTTGATVNLKLDNQGGWATAASTTQGAWHFIQGTGTATADYTYLTLGRRPANSTGDIWLDQVMIVKGEYDLTEFNVRDEVAYDRYKAEQNLLSAAAAQATADGKITSYYQNAEPTNMVSTDQGDLWIDTNDDNKLYRYSGTAWVESRDTGIATAITNASNAQDTADGKINTFYNSVQPSGLGTVDEGDLWFDSGNENRLYRWSGSAWVAARDTDIAQALSDASTAATAAATAASAAAAAQVTADNAQTAAEVQTAIAADTTVINGSRITTGTVDASKITTGTINLIKMENVTGADTVSLTSDGFRITDSNNVVRVKLGNLSNL